MRFATVLLTALGVSLVVSVPAVARRPALSLERAAHAAQVRGDEYADAYNDPEQSEPGDADFRIVQVTVGDCDHLAAWRVECEVDYLFNDGDDCADSMVLWTVRTGRVHASAIDGDEWECASDPPSDD